MLPLLLGLLACVATLAGGFAVWRLGHFPPEILAFSAGMLGAVAIFELLPESFGAIGWWALPSALAGERVLHLWEALTKYARADKHTNWGWVGAGSLVIHSLFDGVIIGVGASTSLLFALLFGTVVILHDFCDGVNTMTLMLRNQQPALLCWLFVGANALAPVAGATLFSAVIIPEFYLGWILSFLAGFLIHISMHELLPTALKGGIQPWRIGGAAFVGILLIGVVTRFGHI